MRPLRNYVAQKVNTTQVPFKPRALLLIIFGKGGCTQCLFLHINRSLTLCAFNSSHIPKSLHTQNITKVNSSFIFTRGTRTIHNFVTREDEFIRKGNGSIVNERSTEGSQNEWVETDEGFDYFKSKTEPDDT